MVASHSFQTYDLDLEKLEEIQDPEMLPQMFQSLIQADNDFKILPARQWMENFLYYGGLREWHSRFSSSTITGNSLLPTNLQNRMQTKKRHIAKVFKACQVQAQNITRQRPSIKVWPAADDEIGERKAKLANILLDYFWDEDCEEDVYYEAILWCLLTPAVARKDVRDYTFNKSRLWPMEEPQTMIHPQTGLPITQMGMKRDQQGNAMMEQMPWYRSELISAFRLVFNPTATWLNDLDFIGDVSIKRMGWLKQNFHINEPGYRPEVIQNIKPGAWSFTPVMAMESALKQLAFGSTRTYRNFTYGSVPVKDGLVVANFFIKPSPNYPDGREIVIANAETVYDGPSRSFRELPKLIWHPYSVMCYERVPSRLWGTTYAEKLTELNRSYDQTRAELDQLRKTFSKPKLMLPIGAQLERDTITGNEEMFRYNPYAADGGKPQYLNPPGPSATIMEDIKLQREEFTEISGVTEIMQGIRPQGVTTYRGLEVLREESSNAANNFIRMYESFIERSQSNKLEVIRKAMVHPDKNLTQALRIFKKVQQYVTDIDIIDFAGEDIAGFVKVESYSSIGKSKLALQSKYESMAQLGVLGDIVNDPDLNAEYKRKMDVQGFDAPKNKQVIYAKYENQQMLQADKMGQPINPQVAAWHDHAIHIRECENLLLDPVIQGKQLTYQSLIQHRQMHLDAMAAQQAEMMKANIAAAMGGPPGGITSLPGKPPAASGAKAKPTPKKQQEGELFGPENAGIAGGSQPNMV